MSEMNGNPHFADHLIDHSATGDGRAVSALVASLSYEQRTANLIAVHTTSSLREQLNLADQNELEKTILRRLGFKDD